MYIVSEKQDLLKVSWIHLYKKHILNLKFGSKELRKVLRMTAYEKERNEEVKIKERKKTVKKTGEEGKRKKTGNRRIGSKKIGRNKIK